MEAATLAEKVQGRRGGAHSNTGWVGTEDGGLEEAEEREGGPSILGRGGHVFSPLQSCSKQGNTL